MFDGSAPLAELRELLRRKYASRPLDLIVAAGSRTLRIALHNRAGLLDRWRLDERRLPAGSRLLFREPSAWAPYRWYIVAATAAPLLQKGLIGTLLVQRAQRPPRPGAASAGSLLAR